MTKDSQQPKKGKGPIFAIVGLVIAALAGGGIWMMKQKQAEAELAAIVAEHASTPAFLTLNQFILTIKSDKRLHHVMLEVDLMSYDRAMLAHLEVLKPLVRNRIVSVVSGKSFEQLTALDIMASLESELLTNLQQLQKDMKSENVLEKVLITKLVIQ